MFTGLVQAMGTIERLEASIRSDQNASGFDTDFGIDTEHRTEEGKA